MSLPQYPPPVDYAAQTNGFRDFLKGFKSFQSSSEAAATEAMQDLNIDGGRTSDEYDFMDDADEMDGATTRGSKRQTPKVKYMQILQDVANRDTAHIQIDLDDLETVSIEPMGAYVCVRNNNSRFDLVRKIYARGGGPQASPIHRKERTPLC